MCAAPALVSAEATATEGLRHGSRATAKDGTLVVYDNVNGIFMVPGRKSTFWLEDRFYQYDNGVWTSAKAVKGPWTLTAQQLVPEPARVRFGPIRGAKTASLPSGGEAVYDPKLRAYKVTGKRGVFLADGLFYRYDGGIWQSASQEGGPWSLTSSKPVPGQLRKSMPAPKTGDKVKLPSGESVVFDAENSFHRLDDKPSVILFDGMFYEKRDEKWFASPEPDLGFQAISTEKVPGLIVRKDRKASGTTSKSGSKPKSNAPKKDAAKKKDSGSKAKGSGQKAKASGEKAKNPNHKAKDSGRKAKETGSKAKPKQAAKKPTPKNGANKPGASKAAGAKGKAMNQEVEPDDNIVPSTTERDDE